MFNDGETDVFYAQRWFYVLIIALLLLPVILKKELAELEWCSWVLFGSIGLFIILNLWELTVDKNFQDEKSGLSFDNDIWVPNHGFGRTLNAVSVTMVAYCYQCNLFPIYTSLKDKNNAQYMKTNNYGLMLTCAIYITVALISVAMFGINVGSVVLDDIGTARHNGKAFWEGYATQFSFIVLLACHIPFIFFAGKEGLLIIIDEYDRKSISNALFHKLYATNATFEKENKDKMPPAPTLAIPGGEEKVMEFG
jgi:amino acid permease